MRIFISGAQRVGKTTVARELAKALNLDYLDAKVSEAIRFKNETNPNTHLENSSAEKQYDTQEFVYNHLKTIFSCNDNFITDRCLLDNNAYSAYIMDKLDCYVTHINFETLSKKVTKDQNKLFESDDTITFIINPSKDFPFVPDEKSGGVESQKRVAESILEQAYTYTMECQDITVKERIVVVPDWCTGVERRVEFCLNMIKFLTE